MPVRNYEISLTETQALKGIAIIAMLVHHLFYTTMQYGALVNHIGWIGKVCVAIFLFLSGYGLTFQYMRNTDNSTARGTLKFLYRRFVKFYLNYWFVFLIAVPLGVFAFGRTLDQPYGTDTNHWLMLLTDFLGLNDVYSYNITWWFNRLIIIFYLLFPILFRLTAYKPLVLLSLPIAYLEPSFCPFYFGIVVSRYRENVNTFLNRLPAWSIVLMAAVMAILLCFVRELSDIPFLHGTNIDALTTLCLALLIVGWANVRPTDYRVLTYLGKHSMNMYLVHTFIFLYFFSDFIYQFRYPVLIVLALLLTSLALSIAIEQLKKVLSFYKFQDYLLHKL